jgi:hypothetical protein
MSKSITIRIWIVLVTLAVSTPIYAETPEELIALHDAQIAALNAHDIDTMMSYFADDSIYFLVSQPPPVPKPYVRMSFESRFQAMPDFRMTEGRTLAAGNVVVEEAKTLYTDPVSGAEVVIPHLSIYEYEGDKIKNVTSYNDRFAFMIATGMIPAPEMPNLVPSVEVPDPEPTGLSPMEADAELVERWQSHDPALVAKMCGADLCSFAGPLGMQLGRDEMTALNEMYYKAFPDIQLETVRRIDLGDGWILIELFSKGTHQGDFMGVPASGYLCELRVVWLTRYDANGLAIEQSFYYDNLTLLNQMTNPPYSLDGIWVTTIPTPMGNLNLTTIYVAQDAAKTQYSGTLEEVNPMPLLADIYPGADPSKDIWAGGHAVMVGRDRYEATFLGYIRKTVETEVVKSVEIVGLVTVNAHFEVIGPDFLYGQGTESCYLASQDADRDGFPDDGQKPVAVIPWGWTSKRLTQMPEPTQ